MTESWRILKILMWKQLVVRRKRIIQTAVELVAPLIFFLLLFVLRNQLNPVPSQHVTESRVSVETYDPYPLYLPDDKNIEQLVYTPDNAQTRQLMDKIGPKLGMVYTTTVYSGLSSDHTQRLRTYGSLPDESYVHKYVARKMNESEIYNFHNFAVLIFHNLSHAKSLPKKLEYTIKMNGDFRMHSFRPEDGQIIPHFKFGADYLGFMRVQWAVDSSYLALSGANGTDLNVELQEFPFVNTQTNQNAATVVLALQLFTYLSLGLTFVFFRTQLVSERVSGVQELIKMVGVSENLLNLSHFLNTLPAGLVFSVGGVIFCKCGANPLLQYTSGVTVFVTLLLYYVTIVMMAFATGFAKTSQYATSFSVMLYILSWVPSRFLATTRKTRAGIVAGLLPHVPMNWYWYEVLTAEMTEQELTLSKLFTTLNTAISVCPFGVDWLLMLLQTGLLALIAWYLGKVMPSKYGLSEPLNFLCKKKPKVTPHPSDESEEETVMPRDPRYFEAPPPNAEPGIRIQHVSKAYGKDWALNNVSFDVFKGEITVLLGHNGAGKTTLMNIITGLTRATHGKVFVNDVDAEQQRGKVSQQLGLCPQHNLFFPDLNVLQHVVFFSMIKGSSYKAAQKSSIELINQLNIGSKARCSTHALSGGMKRRLQLACALAGGSDVLILDEPTSGLDVETRRDLWDLLLSLRGSRCVLLTTHFMEEADALGDRVAAMHQGRLRALATPLYLKKNMGTGYRLSLTTIGIPREDEITKFIREHVPKATLKEQDLTSIEYALPSADSQSFSKLFEQLEARRVELGIDTIGLGVSTLEEVFLKLCSDVDTKFDARDTTDSVADPTRCRVDGIRLLLRQLRVLIVRHLLFIRSTIFSFLFLEVILPIVMICVFTYLFVKYEIDAPDDKSKITKIDLNMYNSMEDPKVLLNLAGYNKSLLKGFDQRYSLIDKDQVNNITAAVLRAGYENPAKYGQYLAGIEMNENEALVHYTTTVRHAAPAALNMLSNLLAATVGRVITVYNDPISYSNKFDDRTLSDTNISSWCIFVTFIILGSVMNSATILIRERIAGTRHIHVMAGCPPVVHWMASLAVHTAVFTTFTILPTIVVARVIDDTRTIGDPHFLVAILFVLVLGVTAFLALTYLVSLVLGERTTGIVLVVVLVISILLGAVKVQFFDQMDWYWYIPTYITWILSPAFSMITGLLHAGLATQKDAACRQLREKYCIDNMTYPSEEFKMCCETGRVASYWNFEKFSPTPDMLVLLTQTIVIMALVILTQHGLASRVWEWLANRAFRPPARRFDDPMVREEEVYVGKAVTAPSMTDALLVHKVYKNFRGIRRSVTAVKGVSFSVKSGECFGLLGVNGAGKSTTFASITGEHSATLGTIAANGYFLQKSRGPYLRSLGYCPQFFGLDGFLTGRQNLTLLLTLRGFADEDIRREVASWIAVVGLEKYIDRRVRGYSGGCLRRLATAAALAQGAPVTLLDEPTAGVDVAARRRVWGALRKGLAHGRAVIITSHSMDEMEALCSRLGILARGELGALGSPAALRAAHARGHAVRLKLTAKRGTDETDGTAMVQNLKAYFHEKFNSTLRDEHKSMLHYHINDTWPYSELFSALESLKAQFPDLVEDYSASETTLEEVFLQFAENDQGPQQV